MRYVATITVYTYGDSPEEALKDAEMQCALLNRQYDNNASVDKLHLQPFGTTISDEIDINKISTEDVEVF